MTEQTKLIKEKENKCDELRKELVIYENLHTASELADENYYYNHVWLDELRFTEKKIDELEKLVEEYEKEIESLKKVIR